VEAYQFAFGTYTDQLTPYYVALAVPGIDDALIQLAGVSYRRKGIDTPGSQACAEVIPRLKDAERVTLQVDLDAPSNYTSTAIYLRVSLQPHLDVDTLSF
jgi:hypothetical protein